MTECRQRSSAYWTKRRRHWSCIPRTRWTRLDETRACGTPDV